MDTKSNLELTYGKVDNGFTPICPHSRNYSKPAQSVQKDKLARAKIGFSLSEYVLQHVREALNAFKLLQTISNLLHWHTILNKLRAWREFFTVETKSGERT